MPRLRLVMSVSYHLLTFGLSDSGTNIISNIKNIIKINSSDNSPFFSKPSCSPRRPLNDGLLLEFLRLLFKTYVRKQQLEGKFARDQIVRLASLEYYKPTVEVCFHST